MIRQATADDIRHIVECLRSQAQARGWEFDTDQATESVRRQAILGNSTVLVMEAAGEITGVLFAVLTNSGFNPVIQAQITNIWTLDHDQDRAETLVNYFLSNTQEVDEVMISQWIGEEFDLPGLVPVITTYRIR